MRNKLAVKRMAMMQLRPRMLQDSKRIGVLTLV